MKTKRNNSSPENAPPASAGTPTWGKAIRLFVSFWLLFHLLALVASPLAGPPPSSELSRNFAGLLEWYIRPLFIGHGYRFFAPNPGPSHRVRYEAELADGSIVEGVFPSLEDQWPRLLYHRMFMLSETINNVTALPPEDELMASIQAGRKEADALRDDGFWRQADRIEIELRAQEANYRRAVEHRDLLLERVALQIGQQHDAERVRLFSQEHLIPTPLDVELGTKLDDEELIIERQVYEWESSK